MSVTNEIQLQKSRQLIDGFKKNINDLRDKGVTLDELSKMSEELDALAAANKECVAIREQLKTKSHNASRILTEVKQTFVEKKKLIKGYYPQEEWIKYGVMDKR